MRPTKQLTKKQKIIIISIASAILLAVVGVLIGVLVKVAQDKRRNAEIQAMFKDYYDAKVASFAEENAAQGDTVVDVVFLGDSLTDGYDLSTYYPQYVTRNRGIGGDTSFGLEARLDVSVYQVKPKVVVMLIGANNQATVMENYERILKGFQSNIPDTKVVLLSLTSMADFWAYNNAQAAYNNAYIKCYAEQYGYTYVDLYTPLFDVTTGEMKLEYTVDGGHFTPEGYQVLTATITPYLQELLGY